MLYMLLHVIFALTNVWVAQPIDLRDRLHDHLYDIEKEHSTNIDNHFNECPQLCKAKNVNSTPSISRVGPKF